MANVDTTPFNLVPQEWAFDPEVGPFVQELLDVIWQLRLRTGGDIDRVASSITEIEAVSVTSSDSLYGHIGTINNEQAFVAGYYVAGDGGGGTFYWNASSTASDDAAIIILPTGHSGAGRWIRIYSDALNVRWFGTKGDGVTDDTAFIQAALNIGGNILGVFGDVYRTTARLLVGDNTHLDFNNATIHKNWIGSSCMESTKAQTTWDNVNISLRNVQFVDEGDAGRGGFGKFTGVDNFVMDNVWVYASGAYDGVNGAHAFNISGKTIRLSNIFIDNIDCGLWGDGIHFYYVEDLVLTNFVIRSGDDSIALHCPNAGFSSSGKNLVSKNISITNGACTSATASSIRIGGDTLAKDNQVFQNVAICNITSLKDSSATDGQHFHFRDYRVGAAIAEKHNNIRISNMQCLGGSPTGLFNLLGNADVTIYSAQKNYGSIYLDNISFKDTDTSTRIAYGGACEKLVVSDCDWSALKINTGTTLDLMQISELVFLNTDIVTDTSANSLVLRWMPNFYSDGLRLRGKTRQFRGVLLFLNTDISTGFIMLGGEISSVKNALTTINTGTITDYIVEGTDIHTITSAVVPPVITATRKSVRLLDGQIYFNNVGSVGTGVTAFETGDKGNHRTALTLSSTVSSAITGGSAQGVSRKVYEFPAGAIIVDSAYMSVGVTQTDGNINADTPDVGLGSLPASGAISILGGTPAFESYITGQTAANCTGTATVKTASPTAGTPFVIEAGGGHNVYFNLADTWAASGDAGALLTGTIVINWRFLE